MRMSSINSTFLSEVLYLLDTLSKSPLPSTRGRRTFGLRRDSLTLTNEEKEKIYFASPPIICAMNF